RTPRRRIYTLVYTWIYHAPVRQSVSIRQFPSRPSSQGLPLRRRGGRGLARGRCRDPPPSPRPFHALGFAARRRGPRLQPGLHGRWPAAARRPEQTRARQSFRLMAWLLDTNAVIALVTRRSGALLRRVEAMAPGALALSSIVAHELYFGAYRS